MAKATRARLAKKTAPPPNPNAETPQQDEAGPSTSAAPTEEAMEPPPPTPGPVPTPEMDDELLDFGDLVPSTSATPIGDLVPFPSTPTAPMDTGEMTPPPLVIDDRSERIEQLEMELKDRDDTIQFLREQVRNRDALITALRRQLEQSTPTGRPKKMLIIWSAPPAANWLKKSPLREVRHKFAHYTPKKKQQQPKQNDSVDPENALLILGLIGTQKAYRRLKSTTRLINVKFDVFPPLKKVLEIKRRICGPLQYAPIETNAGVGFVCTDVEAALEARLLSANDNLISFGDKIYIKLSGDHGQSCTKITVSFSQAARSNSPSNNFVCAVFPAKDSRENLERYGSTLWEQIDGIRTLAGKRVKL
ncbi:hypothetical protein niasHT_036583 [Heterodera trifolii]|uniref:RRM domain-containing protein n=1 Tax=Heterodera trifolii TaxID=157864 RepID=A0ABD2IH92_9BILA